MLIRPHPQNAAQWEDFDASAFAGVAVHPRGGQDPVDRASKSSFYDSIHHSAGVVGINTSALIESAIVGRTVYTLALPEVRRGTGGDAPLPPPRSGRWRGCSRWRTHSSEHAEQLQRGLAAPDAADRNKPFLEEFVRPFGLDTPAAPRLIEAIERIAGAAAGEADDRSAARGIVRAR